MTEGALEAGTFFAGFATVIMLVGILYAHVFARRFGNYRRQYEFCAAVAGLAFIVGLSWLGIQHFVEPAALLVAGPTLLVLGAIVFFAASRGRYYGSVSDYQVIGFAFLGAGAVLTALGTVLALVYA